MALALLLAWGHAAAQGRDPQGSETVDPVLATVEQYVEAFHASYRPAPHERQALNAAEAALAAAGNELLPRLTFAEGLAWDAYAALSLELEAGIELPLHSSTAESRRGLAELDLEARRLALRSASEDALATLLIEVANLATVTWAKALVADALEGFDSLGFAWQAGATPRLAEVPAVEAPARAEPPDPAPPDPARDRASLGYVLPGERAAFDSYQRLVQARTWLAEQSRIMFGRLARSLDVPEDRLRAPAMADVDRWLAADRTALPDLGTCQEASLLVEAARLRHARNLANDALDALPDYSLALTADVDYDLGPWSTGAMPPGNHGGAAGAGLDAAIALEGRYLVADGWPLGGNVNVAFALDGASQRLNLAWPPLPLPQRVEVDRDEELAVELALIADELRTLRNAAAQARTDLALAQQRLTWAVLDAAPDLSADEVRKVVAESLTLPALTLPALSLPTKAVPGQSPDLVLVAIGLAELRLEHAFARVAELSARVQYLGACARL